MLILILTTGCFSNTITSRSNEIICPNENSIKSVVDALENKKSFSASYIIPFYGCRAINKGVSLQVIEKTNSAKLVKLPDGYTAWISY